MLNFISWLWSLIWPRERVISRDEIVLTSKAHGLVVRPDRIIRRGVHYVPVEKKSGARVLYRSAELQLGAAFLAIEAQYGLRPPHGLVVLADDREKKIKNSEVLRASTLDAIRRIRKINDNLSKPAYVRPWKAKCNRCGFREVCKQKKWAK